MRQNHCLWLHGSSFNALKQDRVGTETLGHKTDFEPQLPI